TAIGDVGVFGRTFAVVAPEPRGLRAGAAGIFPLRLGWQAIRLAGSPRQPVGIGGGVLVADAGDRVMIVLGEAGVAPVGGVRLFPALASDIGVGPLGDDAAVLGDEAAELADGDRIPAQEEALGEADLVAGGLGIAPVFLGDLFAAALCFGGAHEEAAGRDEDQGADGTEVGGPARRVVLQDTGQVGFVEANGFAKIGAGDVRAHEVGAGKIVVVQSIIFGETGSP